MEPHEHPMAFHRRLIHHCACRPTVGSWRRLAEDEAAASILAWSPAMFGFEADTAYETLAQAVGHETDPRVHEILEQWLIELTGARP